MARYESILELVGNTPLVGVHALSPNPAVAHLRQARGPEPGRLVEGPDRAADGRAAERDGVLQPGDTILEPSSGNTGIGLALVAKLRGYRLRVVLPENVSVERRQLLEIFGAEVMLSPGEEGSNGAIRVAEKLAAEDPSLVMLFQYGNPANPDAHYTTTGPEILRDCPEVDVFVAGLGTSGTLMGVGRYLKEQKPGVRVVAVEPPGGRAGAGTAFARRRVRAADLRPGGARPEVHRAAARVDRVDAPPARRVRRSSPGISSGAAIAGAAKMAATMDAGTIVALAARRGMEVPLVGCVDRRPRRRRRARPSASTTGSEPRPMVPDVTPVPVATRVRKDGGAMATDADIAGAVETLRRGGLVAFPTETVYGLGADADERRRARAGLRGQGPPARRTR